MVILGQPFADTLHVVFGYDHTPVKTIWNRRRKERLSFRSWTSLPFSCHFPVHSSTFSWFTGRSLDLSFRCHSCLHRHITPSGSQPGLHFSSWIEKTTSSDKGAIWEYQWIEYVVFMNWNRWYHLPKIDNDVCLESTMMTIMSAEN